MSDFSIKPIEDYNGASYGSYGSQSQMFDDVNYPDYNGDGMKVDYGSQASPNAYSTGEQDWYDQTSDFLGSKTFSNSMSAAGMGLSAYMNYSKMENERKFQDKMFDLQEGQIEKQDALREGTQSNYNASQVK